MPIGGPTGGGQAGFGSGGPFTGPAEALEYMGDHCYAYSGRIATDHNPSTCLEFTTGNYYSVVDLQFMWLTSTDEYTGDDALMLVYLNGASVGGMLGGSSHNLGRENTAFVISPYTDVKVTAENASGNTNEHYMWIMLTGEIYRTRD